MCNTGLLLSLGRREGESMNKATILHFSHISHHRETV